MKKFTVFIATLVLLCNATLIPAASLKDMAQKSSQKKAEPRRKETVQTTTQSIKKSALAVVKHPVTQISASIAVGIVIGGVIVVHCLHDILKVGMVAAFIFMPHRLYGGF